MKLDGEHVCLKLLPQYHVQITGLEAKKLDWLECRNPARNIADIGFLTNEVLRLQAVLTRRVQEQQDFGTSSGGKGCNWFRTFV
jgi:hypothetical protein